MEQNEENINSKFLATYLEHELRRLELNCEESFVIRTDSWFLF